MNQAFCRALLDARQANGRIARVDNEDIIRLEERIAHLERHIEEQDREIYRQGELVKRLVREVETNRQRLRDIADAKDMPGDERPPHY